MKILIFGSSGFIGTKVSGFLKMQGHEVFSISRSGNNNSMALDISDAKAFTQICFIPDVIVNCASRIPQSGKTSRNPEFLKELFLTNVIGAANISNWAVQMRISKIINCSTLVVVKKPWPNVLTEDCSGVPEGFHVGYCMSKLSQEKIMNEIVGKSETNLIHVRLSSVYGVGMAEEGILFNIKQQLKDNLEIKITNSNNSFDFINVEDVCRSINVLAKVNIESGVINLANGNPVSLKNLVELLKKIMNSTSTVIEYDSDIVNSEANISVEKLKMCIGDVYTQFIALENGLKDLLKNKE